MQWIILHACFVRWTISSRKVTLKWRSLIFVKRGNVGGSMRWLTDGEKPIGFGASSETRIGSIHSINEISSNLNCSIELPFSVGCVPNGIVRLINGARSTAPFSKRTISFISCSLGEMLLLGFRAFNACSSKRTNFKRYAIAWMGCELRKSVHCFCCAIELTHFLTSAISVSGFGFFSNSSSASFSKKQALVAVISGVRIYP